ncbi:CidB/LrgB family autolysis modulator [Infirmifilum lucidum]|uniref:CidB/LrgB family autolysis modulator n=1 Tax=Infirmifilum lucidum TaxID=2776706 RepID=A0A7L9FJ67_9CREN|nr:CidB/LrgB family autolysis modulator [Infirmifilum lucidum]QOJ79063.1 CidB/LrgB family autolysis modulator [Infirmifilum lucidum]
MTALGAFLTLATYYAYTKLYERRRAFYLNPVLLSILTICLLLHATGASYSSYMESAGLISYLLGPAVVSLAVPLYKQRAVVARYSKQILAGIAVGGMVAIVTAVLPLRLSGSPREVVLSTAPKSVTTAIAVGVSEKIGGLPPLTAVLVILTGIMGNAAGVELLDKAGVKSKVARGLAMGVSSHGLGTARVVLEDELEGAVSGLAMALNGVYTSVVLPLVIVYLAP